MIFVDDIVVYGPDEEKHLKDLTLVFEELKWANLTFKQTNCHFLKR